MVNLQAETYMRMNKLQQIQSKIYEIRGQRVMLDSDLAALSSLPEIGYTAVQKQIEGQLACPCDELES